MKHSKFVFSIGCSLALIGLLAGCRSSTGPKFNARAPVSVAGETVANDFDPAWLQSGTNFLTLGPGDVIEVEIIGSPATRTLLTLGPDGKIYFPMLQGLDVWGMTLLQTKEMLQKELSRYITTMPQVAVALRSVSSKSVWVLGRVNQAGVYPMTGPMTLLEAISMAGGMANDEADLRHSFVQRNGQLLPVDFQKLLLGGDMTQNIYLQPDDFVYVPSTLFHEVFVLGAVRSPRTVPFSDQLTLVSAVASAYGPVPGAYLSHVAIVRGSLAEPKVAVVDYRDIVSGRETDIRLEAHDIVYVPYEPFIGLKSYARSILSTFVNTVSANEGANAVVENANRVGIAVPPTSRAP